MQHKKGVFSAMTWVNKHTGTTSGSPPSGMKLAHCFINIVKSDYGVGKEVEKKLHQQNVCVLPLRFQEPAPGRPDDSAAVLLALPNVFRSWLEVLPAVQRQHAVLRARPRHKRVRTGPFSVSVQV